MTVKDLVDKMENGAAHVVLINKDTGVVLLSTIWYNLIEEEYLNTEVKHICIKDYEMRLMI